MRTEEMEPQAVGMARTDKSQHVAIIEEESTSLLQLAINNKVDVATIERLVALKERHEAKVARAEFLTALASFQDKCPVLNKSKKVDYVTNTGAHVHYSYTPLDQLATEIKPFLREDGLSYSFDVTSENSGVLTVWCVLRHTAGHEERASFPVPIDTKAAMSGAQKNGAALTYGKRMALESVLGITTGNTDIDAIEASSVEVISEEQAANLSDLIDETGVKKDKFLKWLKVESVADIPVAMYKAALDELERRRKP